VTPVRRTRARSGLVLLAAILAIGLTGCGSQPAAPAAASPASETTTSENTVAATPTAPAPLLMAASAPVRVQIPAIGVDSPLIDLGLQDDGTMQVPAEGFPAGWFTGAPTPGEKGPAVLAGHIDWGGSPGVFWALRNVVAGNEIIVSRADGSTAVFRVSEVGQYSKDAFPTAAVYADLDHAGLRVITCGGDFDHAAHSYVDNTVVFADLVATG
jgi:sortase (surface protein transpeptidase)